MPRQGIRDVTECLHHHLLAYYHGFGVMLLLKNALCYRCEVGRCTDWVKHGAYLGQPPHLPKKSYVELLTPSTSECDPIWK